jgi:hypothetical protein
MTNEKNINMPTDRHLLAVDEFVGHTRVIRIDFKTQRSKVSNEFAIKYLSAGHFSASDRYKYYRELVYDYSFLLDQLNLAKVALK